MRRGSSARNVLGEKFQVESSLPGIEAVEFSFPCALKMNLFGNNTPNAH
jgi:hypothetical protein